MTASSTYRLEDLNTMCGTALKSLPPKSVKPMEGLPAALPPPCSPRNRSRPDFSVEAFIRPKAMSSSTQRSDSPRSPDAP